MDKGSSTTPGKIWLDNKQEVVDKWHSAMEYDKNAKEKMWHSLKQYNNQKEQAVKNLDEDARG